MRDSTWEIFRGFFAFVSGSFTVALVYFYFDVERARWLLVYLQVLMCICWFSLIWIYVANKKLYHAILAFVLSIAAATVILFTFASIYRIIGIVDVATKTLSYNPIDCLYFSVVTFTTLGYGDFIPPPELRLVAAAEAFVGYLSLVLIIGVFSHVWGSIVKKSNQASSP